VTDVGVKKWPRFPILRNRPSKNSLGSFRLLCDFDYKMCEDGACHNATDESDPTERRFPYWLSLRDQIG
jgi:hypothetical protein